MELSIAYELYMKPDATPSEKALEICRQAGFRYVDMSIGPFWNFEGSPIYKDGWEKWADELKQTADSKGIRMLQAHSYNQNPCLGEADRTAFNHHLMYVAQRLGIEWMVFHPGTMHGEVTRKASLDSNVEWFLRMQDTAEKTGVKIALENVFDWVDGKITRLFGVYPDDLLELIERIGHPDIGVCWDTGHAHLPGLDQYKAITLLGDKLKVTHIHDNRGRLNYDLHVPPFYGSVDWQAVMTGLRDIHYQGTFNFEIERHTIPDDYMLDEFRHLYHLGEFLCGMAK